MCRNSISAERPENATIGRDANITGVENVTEVPVSNNDHLDVSSNHESPPIDFSEPLVDFSNYNSSAIDFSEPIDENETWDGDLLDFESTTTLTSTTVTTTSIISSSTMTSTTSTTSKTETSTTKEFFIARNKASALLEDDTRLPRSSQLLDPSRHEKIMWYKYRESEESAREYAFYLYYEYDFVEFSKID